MGAVSKLKTSRLLNKTQNTNPNATYIRGQKRSCSRILS